MSVTTTGSPAWLPPTVATERRVILTRAAEQEARRQSARERGDRQAERQAERELLHLWQRYGQLGGAMPPAAPSCSSQGGQFT